jgi:hypothetical protein
LDKKNDLNIVFKVFWEEKHKSTNFNHSLHEGKLGYEKEGKNREMEEKKEEKKEEKIQRETEEKEAIADLDVTEWIYDIEADYHFLRHRAIEFLQFIGIVRQDLN